MMSAPPTTNSIRSSGSAHGPGPVGRGRRWRRRPGALLLAVVTLALAASACRYDPAAVAGNRSLAECFGRQATIGIGWYGPNDGPSGTSYLGTEGDDVVVITNGPVRFDGLGGNDLICVNDTGMTSSTPPIIIDAGDGDDRVWDRRYRHDPAPAHVVLEVDLGDGEDAFYGSGAKDVVDAGPGADEINGGGGIDELDCGDGMDLRWVGDFTDPSTVAQDCEREVAGYGPVDEGALQVLLDDFVAGVGAPGSQLGVRVPGRPDIVIAAGLDDVRADPATAMPIDGTFPIASITKTFTSAVVLQLVNEGRLSFDDTLHGWVPDYPHAAEITVRMMLEHTSGMVHGVQPAGWLSDPDHAYTLAEILVIAAEHPPFGTPPTPFHYSNMNYVALGAIIEDLTGVSLADAFQQRIFDPLGMDDTVLDAGNATITQHGWRQFGDLWVDFLDLARTPFMTWYSAAGAVVSSTEDMLEWGEALYGGEFLSEPVDAELHVMAQRRAGESVFSAADPDGSFYSGPGVLGWCPCDPSTSPPTPSLIGHTGGFPAGTATRLVHDTTTGVTVSIRSNSFDVPLEPETELANDVIALVTAR